MRIIATSCALPPPMRHQVWKDCHLFCCDSGCSLLFGHQTEMKDVGGGSRALMLPVFVDGCSRLSRLPGGNRETADCLGKAFVCIFVATCYSEVCAPAPGAYRCASDGFLPPTEWKWKRVLSSPSSLTLFPSLGVLRTSSVFCETMATTLLSLCQQPLMTDFNPLLFVKAGAAHIREQRLFEIATAI